MGHGVRAALITAMMRAMIETHATEAPDTGRLLTQLNSEFTGILRQTGTLVFVTVLYCVINVREGIARFSRAGHPPPLKRAEVPAKCRRSSWARIPPDLR